MNIATPDVQHGAGRGDSRISGSLKDYGISDDFVEKLGATIPPGSSALFVLFRSINEDKVVANSNPISHACLRPLFPTRPRHSPSIERR
ncbi:MAG: DUF1269 domain-containing protein [Rhodomicrobium sp.]